LKQPLKQDNWFIRVYNTTTIVGLDAVRRTTSQDRERITYYYSRKLRIAPASCWHAV